MSTKKKIVLSVLLGALIVMGIVLLSVTGKYCFYVYSRWLKIRPYFGTGYFKPDIEHYYKDYLFYFIGIIIALITFLGIILYMWFGKTGIYKARMTYEEYKERQVLKRKEKAKIKTEKLKAKQQKLQEKIEETEKTE